MATITEIPTSLAKQITDVLGKPWLAKFQEIVAAGVDVPDAPGKLAVIAEDGKNLASSGKTVPTGDIAGTSDPQTFTNKTIIQPTLTLKTINAAAFTLDAAVTTTIANATVKSTSIFSYPCPMNQQAADAIKNRGGIFIENIVDGVSFDVTTQDGIAAAGTEEFTYLMFNN